MSRERAILHLDMDAFFASVEALDDPSLRGVPVIVGGGARRGVVASASYEARPFGVRSAMPTAEALRRCPTAVVVAPRHDRYSEVSDDVFAIFRRYTPLVEGLSLDEAFLDVTSSRALFGEAAVIAKSIKHDVRVETGLTISAGVAPNKFVAKIASDFGKPDGLFVVPNDVAAFLAPLPVERMWGVGEKAAADLRRIGLSTFGDLAVADAGRLTRALGSYGARVAELARGEDDRPVEPEREAQSIGAEATFDTDLVRRDDVERALLAQATRTAARLMRDRLRGRVVIIKLKYADFTLVSRRVTLPEAICDTATIYETAKHLLASVWPPEKGIRLTGVAVSGLGETPPVLFPDKIRARREALERALADTNARYGEGSITRADLLLACKHGDGRERKGDTGER